MDGKSFQNSQVKLEVLLNLWAIDKTVCSTCVKLHSFICVAVPLGRLILARVVCTTHNKNKMEWQP